MCNQSATISCMRCAVRTKTKARALVASSTDIHVGSVPKNSEMCIVSQLGSSGYRSDHRIIGHLVHQMSLSSGGGLIMLSSCSLGEVSSCVAGLYLPSDFRF